MLRSYKIKLWEDAKRHNDNNILTMLKREPQAKLLDLGCNNGEWNLKVAHAIGTKQVYGIEIDLVAAEKAKAKGIIVKISDLNEKVRV